jgi:hypothetical protein
MGGCEEKGQSQETWKGATNQRELEYKSRRIAIVEAATRQLLMKTLQAAKGLANAVVMCKLWRLVVVPQLHVVQVMRISGQYVEHPTQKPVYTCSHTPLSDNRNKVSLPNVHNIKLQSNKYCFCILDQNFVKHF